MPSLSPADVLEALGSVEDGMIAEIIATGATSEELLEARAWMSNDEALVNEGRPLASSRVGQLIDTRSTLEEGDEEKARRG
ncbi:MAG TPA: hypothetical protein VGN85_05240 [Methyloceanibacter sp.]|jgi:hypothetical protein|nr:hypothetical protein [Methyloceanibacter sp.]